MTAIGFRILAAGTAGLLWASTALAQPAHLELYAGLYRTDDDIIEEEEIYGVRGGYILGATWGLEISAGQFDESPETSLEDPIDPVRIRLQAFLLDVSFVWRPFGDSWLLFGGPSLVDADYELFYQEGDESASELLSSRDLAWHGGLAYRWSLAPGFYVRFDLRGRYGDTEFYEQRDVEASVAAGWRF